MFRKKMGWTKIKMADTCGINRNRYCEIENLVRMPVAYRGDWSSDAGKISSVVGIPEEELFPSSVIWIVDRISVKNMNPRVAAILSRLSLPPTEPDPSKTFEKENLLSYLDFALNELTKIEKEVLILKFGLNDGPSFLNLDIAIMLKRTPETISHIATESIRKLRDSKLYKTLESFMETK